MNTFCPNCTATLRPAATENTCPSCGHRLPWVSQDAIDDGFVTPHPPPREDIVGSILKIVFGAYFALLSIILVRLAFGRGVTAEPWTWRLWFFIFSIAILLLLIARKRSQVVGLCVAGSVASFGFWYAVLREALQGLAGR